MPHRHGAPFPGEAKLHGSRTMPIIARAKWAFCSYQPRVPIAGAQLPVETGSELVLRYNSPWLREGFDGPEPAEAIR